MFLADLTMTFRKEHYSLIINVIGRPSHDIQERTGAFTLEFKWKIMHVEISNRGRIVEASFSRGKSVSETFLYKLVEICSKFIKYVPGAEAYFAISASQS